MKVFDLKKFRAELNLTQIDLQETLGVTQGFISRVENGNYAIFFELFLSKTQVNIRRFSSQWLSLFRSNSIFTVVKTGKIP
jgi:predicted transcriptional regulator